MTAVHILIRQRENVSCRQVNQRMDGDEGGNIRRLTNGQRRESRQIDRKGQLKKKQKFISSPARWKTTQP